jgi:hypothetical protein
LNQGIEIQSNTKACNYFLGLKLKVESWN